jgi:hypothetical protein
MYEEPLEKRDVAYTFDCFICCSVAGSGAGHATSYSTAIATICNSRAEGAFEANTLNTIY